MRRCFATGAVRPKHDLIRFVIGPGGTMVPDIAERLPGRGLWLTARSDIVSMAIKKRLFARAAHTRFKGAAVTVEDELPRRIEALLAQRAVEFIGLARRAGLAVAGFAKVRAMLLASGSAGVLLAASDGAEDGRTKLRALAPAARLVEVLTAAELGSAFGREMAVHGALKPGGLADALAIEAGRLDGFRVCRQTAEAANTEAACEI